MSAQQPVFLADRWSSRACIESRKNISRAVYKYQIPEAADQGGCGHREGKQWYSSRVTEGVVADVEILLADLGDSSCDGRSDASGPCKIAIRYEHEFAPDTNGREPEFVLHSIVLLFVES